jgi:hypothetical protein
MKIVNHFVSNIKTSTETPKSFDAKINQKLSDKLAAFMIKDDIQISDKGLVLLESNADKDKLDFKNVKVKMSDNDFDSIIKNYSSNKIIDRLFIDSALKYKNELMSLEKSTDSAMNINQLEATYIDNLDFTINRIASGLDRYFDKGQYLSDVYSETPLDDLFDKELFKENLIASVIEMRDYVLESDEPSREDLEKKLAKGSKTTSIENLAFNDLKVLYKFTKEPPEFGDSIDQYDTNSIKKITSKEKKLNERIQFLNLPEIIKKSMVEVNRRVSDGMLKHVSYQFEQDNYIYEMQEYDRMMQQLLKRLYNIGLSLDQIQQDQGVSPENKRLLRLLDRKETTTIEYNELKSRKDDREKEFKNLENNKYAIVKTDIYIKVKGAYDKEMNSQ